MLALRFWSVAARLNVLDFSAPDLALEKVTSIVSTHLSQSYNRALASRLDINDPNTIWDLMYVDAVLRLEEASGKSIRVGVFLEAREGKAHEVYSQARKAAMSEVRSLLGIDRYWVFCLNPKRFPTDEEWVDLLYAEIDRPVNGSGCKLIPL